MVRVPKKEWVDICECEYIGVEFNVDRSECIGDYTGNCKASVFKIGKDKFCFHDPLEVKGPFFALSEKIVKETILELLEEVASEGVGIRVYTFNDPLELNEWLVKQ